MKCFAPVFWCHFEYKIVLYYYQNELLYFPTTLKAGFHLVVIVVSTVANMFLTLF